MNGLSGLCDVCLPFFGGGPFGTTGFSMTTFVSPAHFPVGMLVTFFAVGVRSVLGMGHSCCVFSYVGSLFSL